MCWPAADDRAGSNRGSGNCARNVPSFAPRPASPRPQQMSAVTTHWYHVMNIGAGMLTLSALSSTLFTNTSVIEMVK